MIESVNSIAEIICRCAIFERVCWQSLSSATHELQRALVKLYATIMIYLSKARSYFEQNTASKFLFLMIGYILTRLIERIAKSGLLRLSDIESHFGAIATAQENVDRCTRMVEMQGRPG